MFPAIIAFVRMPSGGNTRGRLMAYRITLTEAMIPKSLLSTKHRNARHSRIRTRNSFHAVSCQYQQVINFL